MTAPENKLFSASDRYHKKRKIRMDELIQRVHLWSMDLYLALGWLPIQSSLGYE